MKCIKTNFNKLLSYLIRTEQKQNIMSKKSSIKHMCTSLRYKKLRKGLMMQAEMVTEL